MHPISPPLLQHVSNLDAKIILVSENDGIEYNKDGETETVFWDKGGKYPSSDVGEIRDNLTLKVPC